MNIFLYEESFAEGTFITSFEAVFLNVFAPTFVMTLEFTLTLFSFVQPLNTSFPICFTFEPIVTVVSFFAFLNTEFEIFTTLYFVFPTVIVAGMLTVLSDAFFEFDAYSTPVILFDDLIYLYVTFPILTFFASLVFVLSFLLSLLTLLLLSFLFGLSSSSSSLLSGC